VDLGAGTGHTAAWLRRHDVGSIDGVDLTPEMLDAARSRGAHDRLVEADVAATGLETNVYLISEHVTAGLRAGWTLIEMRERVIDDEWLALKPKWSRFRSQPVSVAFVWRSSPMRMAC
jgi:hypothetical protein